MVATTRDGASVLRELDGQMHGGHATMAASPTLCELLDLEWHTGETAPPFVLCAVGTRI